jgi:hypothetical protein
MNFFIFFGNSKEEVKWKMGSHKPLRKGGTFLFIDDRKLSAIKVVDPSRPIKAFSDTDQSPLLETGWGITV